MKLYNTLTKQVEEIVPVQAPQVGVYTCGPTVYDYPHVGNWFTYIREDILIRTLKASSLQPKWVMNITDVGHLVSDADDGEDKLEKGAKREGKTAWDVAVFYTDYFVKGMERLGILPPDLLPRATEHVAEQIALIQTLEAKGFTYTTSDGVYYDTSKFPAYASFAGLDLDEQQAGARVEINAEKHNQTDFALWKFAPTDRQRDMEWDSPWGRGFPGWHIECSAMSMKYLGETLDIHAGGIDHVPVHHTNEIAQSEAANGKPFANHWMHSNHITIEGDKISKSLGNGITLEDIEAKGISLAAFRLHVLESHYRSQSKFSWESLEAAQNRLRRWQAVADQRWQALQASDVIDEDTFSKTEYDNVEAGVTDMPGGADTFLAALQNDLDTPTALVALEAVFNTIERSGLAQDYASDFTRLLELIRDVLGIDLLADDISEETRQWIMERDTARASENWTRSDELRDQLAERGIGVHDTPNGAVWFRT